MTGGAGSTWGAKLAWVWGGELVSVLTSSILQMGFIWHITMTTGSAGMLSLASLMGFLPLALLGPFAGTLVDRLSVKRVLIGADLFIAAVSAAVAMVSLAGALPAEVVIVALFFRAIGSALHTPAFQALTPLVAPPEHLTRLAGISQVVQSGGYILGTAVAAVIYPLWGLTTMIALDVAGALAATVAILAARLDLSRLSAPAGGSTAPHGSGEAASASGSGDAMSAPEQVAASVASGPAAVPSAPERAASPSVPERAAATSVSEPSAAVDEGSLFRGALVQVRAIMAETLDGYRVLRGYRGLFALLWCGFAFTLVFSPISALFPLMSLDHFGGTTSDAALAEIVFSVGMIAGSALLATTGGFKNRALTVVAATALYGVATFIAGTLAPDGFPLFLAMSFLMGVSSPFYSGSQTALMQEKVPPEYLGRVFGLYGSIMSWAMPAGLAVSSVFADVVGAPVWFAGAGAAMAVLAVVTWLIPSIRHIED